MSDRSRIAFQGVPGAYSHMACTASHPEMDPIGFDTFAQAFGAVEDGTAELAMIPIENTLGGFVDDVSLTGAHMPEPSAALVFATGLGVVSLHRRRARR